MAIKAELITQLEGFGNRSQKRQAEHFRSMGLTKSAFGMVSSAFVYKWFSDYQQGSYDFPQYTTFAPINHISYGRSKSVLVLVQVTGFPVLYFLDNDGNILQSKDGVESPANGIPPTIAHTLELGILVDLLRTKESASLPWERYLGMFDPDVADTSHTVTLTNGAKQWSELPETTLFLLFLVNSWWFRVVQIGYFYRISSYTDANNITLNSNFALATGITTWKSSEGGLTGGKTSALTCQAQMQTDMTSIFLAKYMKILFFWS